MHAFRIVFEYKEKGRATARLDVLVVLAASARAARAKLRRHVCAKGLLYLRDIDTTDSGEAI